MCRKQRPSGWWALCLASPPHCHRRCVPTHTASAAWCLAAARWSSLAVHWNIPVRGRRKTFIKQTMIWNVSRFIKNSKLWIKHKKTTKVYIMIQHVNKWLVTRHLVETNHFLQLLDDVREWEVYKVNLTSTRWNRNRSLFWLSFIFEENTNSQKTFGGARMWKCI